jgi:hypothetical protein
VRQVPQDTIQSALQLHTDRSGLQTDLLDAIQMQRHAHQNEEAGA